MATRQKSTQRKPARTEAEWWKLIKSDDTSFIRSMKDWRSALANEDTNPLAGCDPKTIAEFTKSLKFNNGGFAHAYYGGIAKELSYERFSKLWARFGVDMRIFEDHKDAKCDGQHNCVWASYSTCMSSC